MNKDLEKKIKKQVILFLKTNEPKDIELIEDHVYKKLSSWERLKYSSPELWDIVSSLIEDKLIADARRNKYGHHKYISTYAGIKFLRDK
jgi:hypothetical protein